MTRRSLAFGSMVSMFRTSVAAVRRMGDGVVIAGALVAAATAIVAALALFAMFGRLSHRTTAAAAPPPAARSLPADSPVARALPSDAPAGPLGGRS